MKIKAAVFITILALSGVARSQNVTLTAAPTSATFLYVQGGTIPTAQAVAVKASAGTPAYTVAVAGNNVLWVTASPDSGRIPASLSIRVNPTGLTAGTYTATVNVSVAGVATPLAIPVTLTVNAPLPALRVSAQTLSFTSPPLQPAAQTLKLNTTGGPVSFTAASGAAWMQVSPTTGVVLPGEQITLTVSVDASLINPQATPYSGKITIVAAGVPAANKTQNVVVSLLANASTPAIASVWPPSVQINSAATTVTLRGANFYTATVVKINGVTTPLATTVFSPTTLIAVIPATSLTTAGTLNLIASNPAPGGDSPPAAFTVAATPVVQAAVSVASNNGASLSPGELITLFGAGIGPVVPAVMADADNDGFVDTTLGGVSVAIDGQPAPLLYVSQNQISVQVPYAATIGTGKTIVVTNGAVTANGTATIAAVAPGLFTLDGSGTGPAAALNYNASTGLYTLNQASAAAKPGDLVLLYLTGEGDYATGIPVRTGLLVPASLSPLPQLSPLPTVTIGGAAATVQYAGPLVGSILGLIQLNVTVPANSATGAAVPVSVAIGGISTQSGVTLAIHP